MKLPQADGQISPAEVVAVVPAHWAVPVTLEDNSVIEREAVQQPSKRQPPVLVALHAIKGVVVQRRESVCTRQIGLQGLVLHIVKYASVLKS